MLPEVHLVTKRGGVLCLDTNEAQQRLENNLRVEEKYQGKKKKIRIMLGFF